MYGRVSVFGLGLAFAGLVFAQVAGQVTGSVVDPSGAQVPNAKVSLYLTGGKTPILTTHTTSDGVFNFSTVRPETYRLQVEATGFAPATQENVVVDPVHATALRPIQVSIQATAATIEVAASSATLDTSTAEITSTVTNSQVVNLPVLDRQASNLWYTQPGVNSNGRADTVINGLRAQNTNVTLDGVNVQDNFIRINGLDYIPNKLTIGEVAEITVSSSNANPTVGGNANAISLSTPSGTNRYHGNAYWFNRNSAASANDWFNNRDGVDRPFLNLNQFGGSIGGPIKKDKLLFFVNYETYDEHQTFPESRTILTPTAAQGILQYRVGGAVQQFNILQDQGLQIDKVMQAEIAQLPKVGNSTSQGDGLNTTGFQFNERSNERRDSIVGKIDYMYSPKNVFSGTYRWSRDIVDRPDIGGGFNFIPAVSNNIGVNLFSASWRWNPKATLTNELRGGGNLATAPFDVSGTQPTSFIGGSIFSNPVNTFLSQGRTTNSYNLQDNANWVHGRHIVSFGFQTQQNRTAPFNFGGIVPTYNLGFSATSPFGFGVGDIPGASATDINTANNLLQSLAGIVTSATQLYNITSRTSGFVPGAQQLQHLSFNDYAGYVTDTWKIKPRFTAVLGVRWDFFPPVKESDGLLIQPTLINNNPVTTLLSNASLNFVGNSLYHNDLHAFAPNVGLAWDARGNGKTVIRAGVTTVCHHNAAIPRSLLGAFPIRVVDRYGWAHSLAFGGDVRKAFLSTPPGSPFIIHLAEGTDQRSKEEIFRLDNMKALGSNTVVVHGVGLDKAGHLLLEERGAGLVWCPTSNVFTLGRTLDGREITQHMKVALGSDSVLTGKGDLLDEIRSARDQARLDPKQIYSLVTDSAARVLRLRNGEGAIRLGGPADFLAVLDTGDRPCAKLSAMTTRDLEVVMVGGRPKLLSAAAAGKWPRTVLDTFEVIRAGNIERLVQAPIRELLESTRKLLGEEIFLAGKRVTA